MMAYSDKHSERGDSAEKVPMQPRRWYSPSSSPPPWRVRVWMSQVTKRGYCAFGSVTRSRVLVVLVAAVVVVVVVVVDDDDDAPEASEEEEELAPAPARRARRVRAGIFLAGEELEEEEEDGSDSLRWVR